MMQKKSILRAVAILALALGAGHLVQTLGKREPQTIVLEPVNITPTAAGAVKPAEPAQATAAETAPAPEDKPVQLAALTDQTPPPVVAPPADPAGRILAEVPAPLTQDPANCGVRMEVKAGPQATIQVDLSAPCTPGQRVVLRHAGLVVAESLDASGGLKIDIPALDAQGEVSALLPDTQVAVARAEIQGIETRRRFAVQWMNDDTFQLSAYEAGADYGTPGHVSATDPVSVNGGYLVTLGDPALALPMMAQIYTWPATTAATPVIEAAVTELTCERELLGKALISEKGKVTISDLSLAMPGCDSIGDILVLNNPVPEMTLAAGN